LPFVIWFFLRNLYATEEGEWAEKAIAITEGQGLDPFWDDFGILGSFFA
jgi:hypothetical protein